MLCTEAEQLLINMAEKACGDIPDNTSIQADNPSLDETDNNKNTAEKDATPDVESKGMIIKKRMCNV